MNAIKKWAKRSVWITLVAVSLIGCNPIQTIGFIFRDDPKVQPKYPLRPKEGPKKEKNEEISVLVLCDQRPGLPADEFAGANRELAENINRFLPDMAKANKEKLKMISSSDLANYQAKNPGWKNDNPARIGKLLGADCVLYVYIGSANLYQPGTNRQLYDAKADVEVNVYDLTGEKPVERHYPHHFDYKPNRSPDASNTNPSLYRQGYLETLAKQICWKHIEHPSSEEVDP
jgi:hypothetical protein